MKRRIMSCESVGKMAGSDDTAPPLFTGTDEAGQDRPESNEAYQTGPTPPAGTKNLLAAILGPLLARMNRADTSALLVGFLPVTLGMVLSDPILTTTAACLTAAAAMTPKRLPDYAEAAPRFVLLGQLLGLIVGGAIHLLSVSISHLLPAVVV